MEYIKKKEILGARASSTPSPGLHYASSALEASAVIKAAPGKLKELRFTNTLASAQQVQIHDASAVPADTAVPIESITMPASTSGSVTFPNGLVLSTGIVVSNSTTVATKTIGAADCFFAADYK